MPDSIKSFITDENGVSALGYAILLALVIGAVVVIVAVLGSQVDNSFERLNELLTPLLSK